MPSPAAVPPRSARVQPAAPQSFRPPPTHAGRLPQPSLFLPGRRQERTPAPQPRPLTCPGGGRTRPEEQEETHRRGQGGGARLPPRQLLRSRAEPSGAQRSLRRAERLRQAAAAPPAAQARPRRPRSGGSPPAPRRDARPPPGLASAAARSRPPSGPRRRESAAAAPSPQTVHALLPPKDEFPGDPRSPLRGRFRSRGCDHPALQGAVRTFASCSGHKNSKTRPLLTI